MRRNGTVNGIWNAKPFHRVAIKSLPSSVLSFRRSEPTVRGWSKLMIHHTLDKQTDSNPTSQSGRWVGCLLEYYSDDDEIAPRCYYKTTHHTDCRSHSPLPPSSLPTI